MKNLRVGIKLGLGFTIVLMLLIIVAVAALSTIHVYKVNGPAYHRIIQGKDLLADILPPPLYILEAWKVALETAIFTQKEEVDRAVEKLGSLRKDYEKQRAKWQQMPLDSDLVALMRQADQSVDAFFHLAQNDYMESIRGGLQDKRISQLQELRRLYTHHRQGIDALVSQVTKYCDRIEKEVDGKILRSVFIIIIGSILAVVAGIAISWFIARGIVMSLSQGVVMAEQLAAGKLTARISLDQNDEMGTLAQALNHTAENLQKLVGAITLRSVDLKETSITLQGVADGLLQGASHLGTQASQVAAASEEVSVTMETIAHASTEMSTNMATVSSAADEIATNMTIISSAAEEANTNLNTVALASEQASAGMVHVRQASGLTNRNVHSVASAMEEMSISLTQMHHLCHSAAGDAHHARNNINSTRDVMETLVVSLREIDHVVSIINDIAGQTNMLALNAAIESAGAGDAGKGFAVVANEVKELARQTTDATRMIDDKINEIQKNAELAGQATALAMEIIERLNKSNNEVLRAVEEQNCSLKEISHSMTNASQQTTEVTEQVDESSRGFDEVARRVVEITAGIGEVSHSVMEASSGIDEITRRIAETSGASVDVNRNVTAASHSIQEVAEKMGEVNESAEKLLSAGQSVSQQSLRMAEMAAGLEQQLSVFHI
ncbi:MAG: methyl-accepting chemotaxis protein [Magnetococcales bacterium]|nr:methyl-accepting chemotaxis protein [Magnetococcales bacterium]